MTSADPNLFIPPAPEVYKKDLPLWKLIRNTLQSSLSVWTDEAFDILFKINHTLGVDRVLVNDPEGLRHVMTTNADNYCRPIVVQRVLRPLIGDGLFLAKGAEWRRQRRLLAPPFTPTSINLVLPHFQEAGLDLLRTIEGRAHVNLSEAFQDTALEAVLRALFSMPHYEARARLSVLARGYLSGHGRPTLLDGFARSEAAFAFANGARNRFQRAWFGDSLCHNSTCLRLALILAW